MRRFQTNLEPCRTLTLTQGHTLTYIYTSDLPHHPTTHTHTHRYIATRHFISSPHMTTSQYNGTWCHMTKASANHPFCLQLEGQNGQLLHKLELVQLQKNGLCVLVISRVMKQIKNKLFVQVPSGKYLTFHTNPVHGNIL